MTHILRRASWMMFAGIVVVALFVSESQAQCQNGVCPPTQVVAQSPTAVSGTTSTKTLGSTSGLPAGAVLVSERVISKTINGKTVKIKNPVSVPVKVLTNVIPKAIPSSSSNFVYPSTICTEGG